MLVAASKRHLIMVDGMPACAALMVASRIAPAGHRLLRVLPQPRPPRPGPGAGLFHASALLELGMESTDGTGATLAWPLVRSAAALLTEVAEGEDPGPSQPGDDQRHGRADNAALNRAARAPAPGLTWLPRPGPGGGAPAVTGGSGAGRRQVLRHRHGRRRQPRGMASTHAIAGSVPVAAAAGGGSSSTMVGGARFGDAIDARAQTDRLQHQVVVDARAHGIGPRRLAVDRDQRHARARSAAPAAATSARPRRAGGSAHCAAGVGRHGRRGHRRARRAGASGRRAPRPRPPTGTALARRGRRTHEQAQPPEHRAGGHQGPDHERRQVVRSCTIMIQATSDSGPRAGRTPAMTLAPDPAPSRAPPHPRGRGFTLIELMVVLVIIGVLAALIVPNVLDRADDARVTAARTDVNNLMQALKLYKLDNQRYPERRAGPGGAGRQAHRRRDPAELEALPRQAAERPLGPAVPVRQPGREGRDRCLQLRRRRPGRRRRQGCRHRLLAVSTAAPARGSRHARPSAARRGRGFTLIELLVVVALIAIAIAVASLALRDPAATRLEHEAARLSALLEVGPRRGARLGVAGALGAGRRPTADGAPSFRFVGLPPSERACPTRWLDASGVSRRDRRRARACVLGPEPLIGAQRIVLRLDDRRLDAGHRRPRARSRSAPTARPARHEHARSARLHADRGAGRAGDRRDHAGRRHQGRRRADRQRAAPGRRQRRPVVRRQPADRRCAWRASSPGIGDSDFACEQLGRTYRGKLVVRPTPNPNFRRVDAQIVDDGRHAAC